MTGYYTIAAMDAKLAALGRLVSDGDEANASEIERLRTELSTARTELTAAYEQAITSAITQYDGQIREHMAEQITTANARIGALEDRVTALETAVTGLRTDVDKLLGMIQSVVVIPDYSDGSVKCVPGEREYRFVVSPSSVAVKLANEGSSIFRMKAIETLTKSPETFINMPITEVSANDGVVRFLPVQF